MPSQATVRVAGILCALVAYLMLTPPSLSSQSQVTVRTLCADDWILEPPADFDGEIVRVAGPFEGVESPQLVRLTSSGETRADLGLTAEQVTDYRPFAVSPDGRYMIYQPIAEGAPLGVSHVESREFAVAALAPYWNYDPPGNVPEWRERRELTWLTTNEILVRYVDYSATTDAWSHVIAEQVFTVVDHPFQLVPGVVEPIIYPQLALAEEARRQGWEIYPNVVESFSPRGTFTGLYLTDTTGQIPGSRFQFYGTSTQELLADFPPSEATLYGGEPLWSYDESRLFLSYVSRAEPWIGILMEIDAVVGFQEQPGLATVLFDTFGSGASTGGLRSATDPEGPRIAFYLSGVTTTEMSYFVVYNYETREVTAICQNPMRQADVNTEDAFIIWGPDPRYVGYYNVGELRLFNVLTGERYRGFGGGGYIGWIDDPSIPTPPVAVVTHTDLTLVIADEGNYVAEGTTVGDRFGLSLTTQPTADVVATFTTSDPGQLLMSPPGSGAWGMAPTYSVTYSLDGREGTGLWSRMAIVNLHGVPDDIAETPQAYTLTISLSSADPRFNNVTLTEEVTVYDAGVSITPAEVTLDEGTSSSYEVVLTAPPGFIAADAAHGGLQAEVVQVSLTSSSPTDLEAQSSPLTFTRDNWNVPQVVTLNALQPGSYTVTHEVSSSITINPYMDSRYGGNGTNVTVPSVSVTVNEVVPVLSAPVLLSPLDTVTERTPEFSWEPVPEATNYEVQIERADGSQFLSHVYDAAVCDAAACVVTPTIFLELGNYRWRVRASTSPENQSPWSSDEEFFADVGITLTVPTPLIPVNVAITSGSWRAAPFFTWSVVPGTTEYRLRIDNLVTGQTLFEQAFPSSNCNEQTCSVTLNDVGIQVGLYGWQVQAAAPDGAESPWSARAVFIYFGPT